MEVQERNGMSQIGCRLNTKREEEMAEILEECPGCQARAV